MNSKVRLGIGIAAIAVFGVLGFINFKQSMTPYVSFAEARTLGRTVQVAGFPDHAQSRFDASKEAFCFNMTNEDGDRMEVLYRGGKPGNFDQAQSVVVIGDYLGETFEAKQILVKCPSKYEGEETHPGEEGISKEAPTDGAEAIAP